MLLTINSRISDNLLTFVFKGFLANNIVCGKLFLVDHQNTENLIATTLVYEDPDLRFFQLPRQFFL